MTALILSAGQATRLGDIAPGGCKAMTVVGGRTMVEWWAELLDEAPTIVCRSEHLAVLPDDLSTVVTDNGGGPVSALHAGLAAADPDGAVTVIYADTWVSALPDAEEYCAVAAAPGGRTWDLVEDGLAYHGDLPEGEVGLVCVGLYRFADPARLSLCTFDALRRGHGDEVGMAEVVNRYGLPFAPAFAWQDVGDPDALARWRPL